VVEGMGPLKPSNLYLYKGAKSHRIMFLKDEVNKRPFPFGRGFLNIYGIIFLYRIKRLNIKNGFKLKEVIL